MRDSHAHYVLKRCMRPEPEISTKRAYGQDAGEARQPMTLIMVHAQDHLMNSLLAREFSEELIHLYQR